MDTSETLQMDKELLDDIDSLTDLQKQLEDLGTGTGQHGFLRRTYCKRMAEALARRIEDLKELADED